MLWLVTSTIVAQVVLHQAELNDQAELRSMGDRLILRRAARHPN